MFEVSITSFHKSPKSFREAQYGFVDQVLWQLVSYQLQNFLELINVLRLGLKWLVAFKHRPSSPDMVVQRVEVRRVRKPFIFTNEFTAVGSNPVLSQLCHVSCWKMKPWIAKQICNFQQFLRQGLNIKFSIHFGLVWNEMLSSFPIETDARRNHDVLGELCSLSYQPTSIDVCVKAGGGNFEHTLKWTNCQSLVFVITVNILWQWKLQVVVDHSAQNWKYDI